MKKHQLTRAQLRYFAKMATESYANDPVHIYINKNENLRKKFTYHFMIERLATSSREDIIYIDEENRGICIWRDAHNEYDTLDFLMYPNWVFLLLYLPKTIKMLMAYGHLDSKVFPENTLIISPVFVDPKHQGKGIASKLIRQGIEDLTAKGYKLGLEAQDIRNVKFYEKLGFKVIKHDHWKRENIDNYYMMYEEN